MLNTIDPAILAFSKKYAKSTNFNELEQELLTILKLKSQHHQPPLLMHNIFESDPFIQLIMLATKNKDFNKTLEHENLKPLWQPLLSGHYSIRHYYIGHRIALEQPFRQVASAYLTQHLHFLSSFSYLISIAFQAFLQQNFSEAAEKIRALCHGQQTPRWILEFLVYNQYKAGAFAFTNSSLQYLFPETKAENCESFFATLLSQSETPSIEEYFSTHYKNWADECQISFEQCCELDYQLGNLYGLEVLIGEHCHEMRRERENPATMDFNAHEKIAAKRSTQLTKLLATWRAPAFLLLAQYHYEMAITAIRDIQYTIKTKTMTADAKNQLKNKYFFWIKSALHNLLLAQFLFSKFPTSHQIENAYANRQIDDQKTQRLSSEQKLFTSLCDESGNFSQTISLFRNSNYVQRIFDRTIEEARKSLGQYIKAPMS